MDSDMNFTRFVDLPEYCMNVITTMLKTETNLRLLRCGDKAFSTRWSSCFLALSIYPSGWRTHALMKKGRKTICNFTKLRCLVLQRQIRHLPLNCKDIKMLPHSLTDLQLQLRKNTVDAPLPPNLTSLHLTDVVQDFDPLYPLPLKVTKLTIEYLNGHDRLPKHLLKMNQLLCLRLWSSTMIDANQIIQMPSQLVDLDLGRYRGGFTGKDSLIALGKTLPMLESLECYRLPNGNKSLDLSVLPRTLTKLPFIFGVVASDEWDRYPRNLKTFGSIRGICVYGAAYELNLSNESNEDRMDQIPPNFEHVSLAGVTASCPLRFVKRLHITSGRSGFDIRRIKQSQIVACRFMLSVTRLEIDGALERDLENNLPTTDLSVCTWKLQSLKLNGDGGFVKHPIYLQDYIPWLGDKITKIIVYCGDILESDDIELPKSVKDAEFHVWRIIGDRPAPKALRRYVRFYDPPANR